MCRVVAGTLRMGWVFCALWMTFGLDPKCLGGCFGGLEACVFVCGRLRG